MTNVEKEATKSAIPKYFSAKNFSYQDLAVKAGVDYKVIMNITLENWDKVNDKDFRRVWNLVNPEKMDGIIQTTDCKSVIDLCTKAMKGKRCIGLTGDTGCGKTTALKAYALRANVFYYYIDGTVTPGIFLNGLLREMGIRFEGNPNAMLHRVADELNTLDEALLIIDESGKLKDKMILLLHSLRDLTMNNCGIVLAGMPNFKNGLIAKMNKGVMGYSEFFRRINIWHHLEGLMKDEINFVLERNGITDKDVQREFRKLTRFGDLMNEIELYKTVNE